MDFKNGNNFMASFYNIKGYDLTAFFHCVTSSENMDFPWEMSHSTAIVLRLYGSRMIFSHKYKFHIIV